MESWMDDTSDPTSLASNVFRDSTASLVVFLMALPLCLGIALASGALLFSGIVAGIVGAFEALLLAVVVTGVI